MIKAIVFDLDDTLYSELDYVKSGLCYVAQVLSKQFKVEKQLIKKSLFESLEISRSEIFNRTLYELNIFSIKNLHCCIQLYRRHIPKLNLYSDAEKCINYLSKQYPLYIVTDGHKYVQESKLRVLGLYSSSEIKKCYITHRHGKQHSKPSPYCFNLISKNEGIKPENIVYIADNPKKDFIGIKPLGFRTIRLNRGQYKNDFFGEDFEAEHIVNDFKILAKLLASI
jgi:putative hydrolase of the HAD superfamily